MKFQLRSLPDGDYSKPMLWTRVAIRAARRRRGGTPIVLEYRGQRNKPRKHDTVRSALLKTREILKKGRVHQVTLHPQKGAAVRIRAVEHKDGELGRPIDTVGTAAIDKIVGAVRRRFSKAWTVRDMGICRACSDGSSEHCKCNAWDAGTDMNIPAEETWHRITAMGRWVMEQGKLYHADRRKGVPAGKRRGLPVKAVIWMDRYWHYERGEQPYPGVKHVSHIHVSGYPGTTNRSI
jgi:hypothetical protein